MPLTFQIDGASFTLTDICLKHMVETLARTKVKERGFMLCGDSTYLTPGRDHIGGAWSIRIRDCAGRPVYGSYHTHPAPTGYSKPSPADILHIIWGSSEYRRPFLGCRGSVSDQTIRCDTVKEIPTKKEYEYARRRRKVIDLQRYLGTPYRVPVQEVPGLIKPKPPKPPPVPVAKVCRYCGMPAAFLFQGQWYCDQHFTMVIGVPR